MSGMAQGSLRVAVVYHLWPHYRLAVMEAMDRSKLISYTFYGSGQSLRGVEHADITAVRQFTRAPFRYIGPLLWQPAAVAAALSHYDAIIYLGDPKFISTWVGSVIAKIRRKPVLFWTHGWLRREAVVKKCARNMFFSLASRLLVYSSRARDLGISAGYAARKISVVYNSLDVEKADSIVARIEDGTLSNHLPQRLFSVPERPLIICTARLTEACRFDLLIQAAAALSAAGTPVNIILVGDGPERGQLQRQADELEVDVCFFGACYNEEVLGQLIYHADVTVSPGKIGLTAMHSLMYGTPAITHGSLDDQMPEVEAIHPGITGALFIRNDANSLAETIATWLRSAGDRKTVRDSARREIHDTWNPSTQAAILERSILEVTGRAEA